MIDDEPMPPPLPHLTPDMAFETCTLAQLLRDNLPPIHITASTLPTEAAARKGIPVATGCLDYFPLALCAVAEVSRIGNEQHNPGSPLHWDRSKSGDEADACIRHFLQRGTRDGDGARHTAKFVWRALALLEKELEAETDRAHLDTLWRENDARLDAERHEPKR